MPQFRVTTDDGDGPQRCDELLEFASEQAVTCDAQNALADMAKEKLPIRKAAHLGIEVEDETGHPVYQAGLRFYGKDRGDLDREDQEADAAAAGIAESLGGGGPRD